MPLESEDVALGLAKLGVVGTWFGSDSELTIKEVQIAIRIADVELVPAVEEKNVATTRCAKHSAADGKGVWFVSAHEDRDNRQLRERTLVTPAITVVARIHPASCAIQMIQGPVESAG